MRFPSKKEIKKMLKKLENVEGTLLIGQNPTPSEQFRWDLCQNLLRYKQMRGLNQVEFAEFLGIDQARVSEVVHHRIEKVSTDKLIAYNEKINPKVAFKIAN